MGTSEDLPPWVVVMFLSASHAGADVTTSHDKPSSTTDAMIKASENKRLTRILSA